MKNFLSAASKLNKTIDDIIFKTVKGYLNWFTKHNQKKRHNIFFLNVPAPVYRKEDSAKVNREVSRVVELFNHIMKKNISECDFELLDVYKFTTGPDGFSNGLFHIDDCHLSSDAIPELEKQISS